MNISYPFLTGLDHASTLPGTASSGVVPPLAAIIPAYNEGAVLGSLLSVLRSVPLFSEIILVDDGSTDTTFTVGVDASQNDCRIKVIRHDTNLGKGQAVLSGAKAASAPFLLLLDADLVNLNRSHIEQLAAPVLRGKADMTVGLFSGGSWLTDAAHRTTPWLSGQRCLRAELLDQLSIEAAQGYGLETALTVTSRRNGWTCKEIYLTGVTRSPSRAISSLWESGHRRLRIFSDIGRAMRETRGWRVFAPRLRPEFRVLIVILLLLLGSSMAFNRSRAASQIPLTDLPVLDLTSINRVLVISPHPDDESLGSGGLIQAALAQGAEVKVVMLTNGDGQVFQSLALERRIQTGLRDFVGYGEHRQVETVKALQELGLSEEDLLFLGYPDRSLLSLWLGNWNQDCPVQGIFTRAVNTPYKNSYNPLARYCGLDILDDIKRILEDYLPDLVVIPHPNDDHSDHRAAANFTRLALSAVQESQPEYKASIIGYLIHYGKYPQPRGIQLHRPLIPPPSLSGEHNEWFRLDLPEQAVHKKLAALRQYPTQLRLLGRFLPSFARPNEIFMGLNNIEVRPVEYTTQLLHEINTPVLDVEDVVIEEKAFIIEPSNESMRQYLIAGSDLIGWRLTRLGDLLTISVHTRGSLIPGLRYRILIKTPSGETYTYAQTGEDKLISPRSITARLNLSDLGSPSVLAFSADVRQSMTIERTGWYFIDVKEWLAEP